MGRNKGREKGYECCITRTTWSYSNVANPVKVKKRPILNTPA